MSRAVQTGRYTEMTINTKTVLCLFHEGTIATCCGTDCLFVSCAGPVTPIKNLYCCGDSTFPGIGLPAVAASGAICANTLVPVWQHWQMLDEIKV